MDNVIQRSRRRLSTVKSIIAVSLALGTVIVHPRVLESAGPWRALVVDAQTAQPLEGVAVLAVWHRRAVGHPAILFARDSYYKSAEALTGHDGRFRIGWRFLWAPGIGVGVDGPEIYLFKAGYGGWRFKGQRSLADDGAVLEMRPLLGQDERIKYLESRWATSDDAAQRRSWRQGDYPDTPADIPWQHVQAHEAAINAEREAQGLRPIGVGFPPLAAQYFRPMPPEPPGEAVLRGASAVALDGGGNVYVADSDNHRIVKYSPALKLVGTWGSFGRRDGQLQWPRGVAVARDGTVFVADRGNLRVQLFTADGRLLGKWGELRFDELGGGFSPNDIGVTAIGEVVVFTGSDVFRFTSDGWRLGQWRTPWGHPFRLRSRSGIAVDAQGHIYGINDVSPGQGARVVKCDSRGRLVASWGKNGSERGQLFDPSGLAVDGDGRIYVADRDISNPRIVVFDRDGTFLDQWDVRSGNAAELRSPRGLAVDPAGVVYVADDARPVLHRLTPLRHM